MKMTIEPKEFVASVDVHAQYTFTPECPNELPVEGGTEIVSELNAQAKLAKFRIGSKEAHNPKAIWITDPDHPQLSPIKGANVDVRWKPHAIPGTKGFELIEGLPKVTDYDFYIWEGIELDMHPYGICYHDRLEKLSTGVIEFLHHHQVKTILLGGLATDYCVKVSTLQLLKAGFKVIVNLAACRGINPETTQQAIETMKKAGAVFINSVKELNQKQER